MFKIHGECVEWSCVKKSGGGLEKGVDKLFKPLPQSRQKPIHLTSNDRREK